MKVDELRNYGQAFSDAESCWTPDVKARMKRGGKAVVMAALGTWQKIRFALAFASERKRASQVDLSDIRARGMDNQVFLDQQIEYLCLFRALDRVVGTERAVDICKRIMDETAREPMLLTLPEAEHVRAVGDPLTVFAEYFRAARSVSEQRGSTGMDIVEDSEQAFQFDVHWCVWLDLARAFGVPEACVPNCYSDDLVFPDYFRDLGIEYRRTGTLAGGARCCDFRFERRAEPSES
jgi:hypothetical protein